MEKTSRIGVVVPCYRVSETIEKVLRGIPDWADRIYVVDDACPEQSGRLAEAMGLSRVTVLYHETNLGVGGAVITGYRKALEDGCEIIVKVDGDDQMDPAYLPALVEPLLAGRADYTKGNRFVDFKALRRMPKIRLFGNNLLSFLEKAYSGYWTIMDPTNGYTAIHRRVLEKLEPEKLAKDYFFESHMLLHLNLVGGVVEDVPIPARYGSENSSLKIGNVLLHFPGRLLCGLIRRLLLNYFIYNFNMASVYLLIGIPMLLWSLLFGTVKWVESLQEGVAQPTGTIILAALPLILSVELLLQAINIDIQSVPKR